MKSNNSHRFYPDPNCTVMVTHNQTMLEYIDTSGNKIEVRAPKGSELRFVVINDYWSYHTVKMEQEK